MNSFKIILAFVLAFSSGWFFGAVVESPRNSTPKRVTVYVVSVLIVSLFALVILTLLGL